MVFSISGAESAKFIPKENSLLFREQILCIGIQVEVEADLVVLATGVEASAGAKELAEKLRISYDDYGFYLESHPKFRPVETNTAGVYLAGVCQGPKDIPASVGQGSAAAAKVQALFSRDTIATDPQVAHVIERVCVGCEKCMEVCPFGAIQMEAVKGWLEESGSSGNGVSGVRVVQCHLPAKGDPARTLYRRSDTC